MTSFISTIYTVTYLQLVWLVTFASFFVSCQGQENEENVGSDDDDDGQENEENEEYDESDDGQENEENDGSDDDDDGDDGQENEENVGSDDDGQEHEDFI